MPFGFSMGKFWLAEEKRVYIEDKYDCRDFSESYLVRMEKEIYWTDCRNKKILGFFNTIIPKVF